ncbi:unnamed protein product [Angiostrongylus costaricensis]|uniref:TatD family deoxyribonuclease n=1 Tax=Angiostrongylus costaricensis TaxID=334426 RepID=A0A0R3PN46_ANGCS|nr:unnamed protein product [Angiostrongylus costaricensis]
MIDTHCHLVDDKFKSDVDEVIARAKIYYVKQAVVCPEYVSQFDAVMDLRSRHPDFVLAAIGIHPIQKNNKSVTFDDIKGVEEFLMKHRSNISCIGEVCNYFLRYEVLVNSILLKTVHSRGAVMDTIEFLKWNNASRVVLHAFNGSKEEALCALQAGFSFSIPPSFTNGRHKRFLVDVVPLNHLLLETDSPVLGLVKSERNEPAYLRFPAEFIVKKLSFEKVVSATTSNAERLLNMKST